MVRRGRTDFTESDDENLAQYIARVKPTNFGRLGNNLYIHLENSADQKPWAKRHSWQSWRERYKKNQGWFDHHIKKCQRKLREGKAARKRGEESQKESASEAEVREGLYEELFGTSLSSEEEEEEPAAREKSSAPSLPSKDNIYPSIQSIPQPGTVDKEPHVPGSFDGTAKIEAMSIPPRAQEPTPKSIVSSEHKATAASATAALQPTQSSQHIRNKSKKVAVPQNDDTNFFATPSPPPSPPATPTMKPEPPVLQEGPFRRSLKRPRVISDNATNDESWPPKRMKKNAAEDIDISLNVKNLGSRDGVETKKAASTTQPATGRANGPTRLRPPAQVNAVPSSSKVLLPDSSQRHAKSPGIPKSDTVRNSSLRNGSTNDLKSMPNDAPPVSKATKVKNSCPVIDEDERVAGSSSRYSVTIEPMRRLTPNDGAKAALRLPSIFPEEGDDPFIANKPLDKGKTDAISPVNNLSLHDIPPRRIDLRESLNEARGSCNMNSRRSMSSTSGHSVASFLVPEDQELINLVGFHEVMVLIAKHYGFDVDVAKKAFFNTKSIRETELVLQCGKDAACSATSDMLAKRYHLDSFGDDAPRSMRRGLGSLRKNESASNSGSQKAKSSSSSRRANRPSLNFKPRPFDEEADIALSEYSPPHVSRAGQFIRLVKQGRTEEAIDRERRRASGIFFTETQPQAHDEEQRERPLSLLPNSPSTVKSGQESMSIDGGNDNDQPPVTASHKDTVQHQTPEHTSSPVDHHRILFKRISEGLSTLNLDEDDPAVLKLAQEHRELVMNVTEENADVLRDFEQKNNPDLLRLWSLDWVKQKIADM